MKICIIGLFSGKCDEGFKNIAFKLSENLEISNCEVYRVENRDIKKPGTLKAILAFKPDIVHYITAPTLTSILFLHGLKILSGNSLKTVISSVHPYGYSIIGKFPGKYILGLCKPDLILCQSLSMYAILQEMGVKSLSIPNGVDTGRFRPVSTEEKCKLRDKYAIDQNAFVTLHVGHITKNRNLLPMITLQKSCERCKTIIVHSTHFPTDRDIYDQLEAGGCTIVDGYIEKIEELYQLSDCYVFFPANTVFMPLSVLEAMSCDIPVISYAFEGLKLFFHEGEGLFYADDDNTFVSIMQSIAEGDMGSGARSRVLECSWKNIVNRLINAYSLLQEEKK